MDALVGKKFRIALAEFPRLRANAKEPKDETVKQVIVDGLLGEWSMKGGCLVLNDDWYSTHKDEKVIVQSKQECSKWILVPVIKPVKGYLIQLYGEGKVWTANAINPGEGVVLFPMGSVEPQYQVWQTYEV